MRSHISRVFLVVVSALTVMGCGVAGAAHTVRVRYAAEYGCAESSVTVASLAGNAYRARGCGPDVSYVCDVKAFDSDRTCIADSVQRPAAAVLNAAIVPPAADNAPLRTWLDTQRDAILTCTARTTVAVTARWDATGTVTLALGGDLAGTPAEGCVRSAVGAQHVPAGAAGEVLHLVR